MPLHIIRQDITKMTVDAIVNAANSTLLGGGGVDGAIHRAAGPGLLEECRTLGGCDSGDSKITGAYNLSCKYVIHTVGPRYTDGKHGERELLESCYRTALNLAKTYNCESVAFPLISSGIFGYPKDEALKIATNIISEFLMDNDMLVYLAIFDKSSFEIGESLFRDISAFIDDNYVDEFEKCYPETRRPMPPMPMAPMPSRTASVPPMPMMPSSAPSGKVLSSSMPSCGAPLAEDKKDEKSKKFSNLFKKKKTEEQPKTSGQWFADADFDADNDGVPEREKIEDACFSIGMGVDEMQGNLSLEEVLGQIDESFSEMLLRKIDESGMKDSECYKKANIDRKLFSKIRSDIHYKPSKPTVIAFAIALELSLAETKDMLMKAGFALSHSNKFDVIIEYFISKANYDVFEINQALFAFDQNLLGV